MDGTCSGGVMVCGVGSVRGFILCCMRCCDEGFWYCEWVFKVMCGVDIAE